MSNVETPYALLERLEPGIARLLAHNPSPFTFTGTQTYFAGEAEVVVVDPGPDLPERIWIFWRRFSRLLSNGCISKNCGAMRMRCAKCSI